MYRQLLLLLLCHAVAPAPQAMTDSDITYVKLEPPVEAPAAPSHVRESRIESLPLTIPGNVTFEANINEKPDSSRIITDVDSKQDDPADSDLTLPESSNFSEITALPDSALPENTKNNAKPAETKPEIDLTEDTDGVPELTVPEITAIESVPDGTVLTGKTESAEELLEALGSDISDAIPSETNQSDRRGRTYDSIETTDIFEEVTEKYATETETEVPRKRPPKFLPKLSYFQKPQVFVSFPTNSIEKTTRRRFRSHCRCEKIWNCPKLQISVPRCPDEYFLCCF